MQLLTAYFYAMMKTVNEDNNDKGTGWIYLS